MILPKGKSLRLTPRCNVNHIRKVQLLARPDTQEFSHSKTLGINRTGHCLPFLYHPPFQHTAPLLPPTFSYIPYSADNETYSFSTASGTAASSPSVYSPRTRKIHSPPPKRRSQSTAARQTVKQYSSGTSSPRRLLTSRSRMMTWPFHHQTHQTRSWVIRRTVEPSASTAWPYCLSTRTPAWA